HCNDKMPRDAVMRPRTGPRGSGCCWSLPRTGPAAGPREPAQGVVEAENSPGRFERGDALSRSCQLKLAWAGSPGSSSIPRMETIPEIGAVAHFPMGRPADDLEPVVEMIASWSDPLSQRVFLIGVSGCHAILLLGSDSGRMSRRIGSLATD